MATTATNVTNVKRLRTVLDALHGEPVSAEDVQRIQIAYANKHRPDAGAIPPEERAGIVLDVLWNEVASVTLGEEAREAMAAAQAVAFQRGIG